MFTSLIEIQYKTTSWSNFVLYALCLWYLDPHSHGGIDQWLDVYLVGCCPSVQLRGLQMVENLCWFLCCADWKASSRSWCLLSKHLCCATWKANQVCESVSPCCCSCALSAAGCCSWSETMIGGAHHAAGSLMLVDQGGRRDVSWTF